MLVGVLVYAANLRLGHIDQSHAVLAQRHVANPQQNVAGQDTAGEALRDIA